MTFTSSVFVFFASVTFIFFRVFVRHEVSAEVFDLITEIFIGASVFLLIPNYYMRKYEVKLNIKRYGVSEFMNKSRYYSLNEDEKMYFFSGFAFILWFSVLCGELLSNVIDVLAR